MLMCLRSAFVLPSLWLRSWDYRMNGPTTDLQRTYNGPASEGVESSRKAQQTKTSSLSYQSFAKRKARLREYIIWKEFRLRLSFAKKLAIHFISKLIYWFNFLIIYFLHQGASPVFLERNRDR